MADTAQEDERLVHELLHLLMIVTPWQYRLHHVVHNAPIFHHLTHPHVQKLVHVEVLQVHIARFVILEPFLVIGQD